MDASYFEFFVAVIGLFVGIVNLLANVYVEREKSTPLIHSIRNSKPAQAWVMGIALGLAVGLIYFGFILGAGIGNATSLGFGFEREGLGDKTLGSFGRIGGVLLAVWIYIKLISAPYIKPLYAWAKKGTDGLPEWAFFIALLVGFYLTIFLLASLSRDFFDFLEMFREG